MSKDKTQTPTEEPTKTPAPTPSPSLDPQIYAEDGKTWKSKCHGAQGRLKQVEKQRDTQTGGFEQTIQDLGQAVHEKSARIVTLEAQVGELTTRAESIPQLQGQLDAATNKAEKAGRLEVLMKHPRLLSVQVEEQVEGQDPVKVNPFMKLIESTTLGGEDLDQELRRLAAAFQQPPENPVVEGATPPSPVPSDTTDVEALTTIAMELHEKAIAGKVGARDEERKAWAKVYEAQSKPT